MLNHLYALSIKVSGGAGSSQSSPKREGRVTYVLQLLLCFFTEAEAGSNGQIIENFFKLVGGFFDFFKKSFSLKKFLHSKRNLQQN